MVKQPRRSLAPPHNLLRSRYASRLFLDYKGVQVTASSALGFLQFKTDSIGYAREVDNIFRKALTKASFVGVSAIQFL